MIRISARTGSQTRSLSGSASIESQIAELKTRRDSLILELNNLRANGGDAKKIAELKRKIQQIEERIERLEEQKENSEKESERQRDAGVRHIDGFDERI